jgi:hypothetical protein
MLGELCGRQRNVFSMRSDDTLFKEYRKMMNTGMNSRVVKRYEPIQNIQTLILMNNLLKSPDNFIAHLRRFAIFLPTRGLLTHKTPFLETLRLLCCNSYMDTM